MYRFTRLMALVLAFSPVLFAREKKTKPPSLPPELVTQIWKAQSQAYATQLNLENSQAFLAAKQAAADLQSEYAAWRQACGHAYAPATDANGDPTCGDERPPAHGQPSAHPSKTNPPDGHAH